MRCDSYCRTADNVTVTFWRISLFSGPSTNGSGWHAFEFRPGRYPRLARSRSDKYRLCESPYTWHILEKIADFDYG
jgi:hypothetical protein